MKKETAKNIVDGSEMIFGRLATTLAKKLLSGEEVHLINAEKIIIKGKPEVIFQRYLTKRGIKHKGTPERSPVWSKVPHMLVKRMVRGMIPKENSRGKEALGRLMVYTGNPKNLQMNLDTKEAKFDGRTRFITISELCRKLGYSG